MVDHGYAEVLITRHENAPADIFDGTLEVQIQLSYVQCLDDWYLQNLEMRDDGAVGGPIFSAFANPNHPNYLCAQDDPDYTEPDCDVVYAKQSPGHDGIDVRFTIHDTSTIEDSVFFVGPVPCEILTAPCDPLIKANGMTAKGWRAGIIGLWNTLSFPWADTKCGSGLPIKVVVE